MPWGPFFVREVVSASRFGGNAGYNPTMRTVLVAIVGLALFTTAAACHLAASPEPPACDAGTHPENGRCFDDPFTGPVITIAAADAGCSVTPDSIRVAVRARFVFKNEDAVDHGIVGADGQAWAIAKAGQLSPYASIGKLGNWPYTVSGCAKGGTVVVE